MLHAHTCFKCTFPPACSTQVTGGSCALCTRSATVSHKLNSPGPSASGRSPDTAKKRTYHAHTNEILSEERPNIYVEILKEYDSTMPKYIQWQFFKKTS